MKVNGRIVYEDNKKRTGDFEKALRAALKAGVKEDFKVGFALDKNQDGKADFLVEFERSHDSDTNIHYASLSSTMTSQTSSLWSSRHNCASTSMCNELRSQKSKL